MSLSTMGGKSSLLIAMLPVLLYLSSTSCIFSSTVSLDKKKFLTGKVSILLCSQLVAESAQFHVTVGEDLIPKNISLQAAPLS